MIQTVHITQRVITARVTSGGRKTFVSVTAPNRVRAATIGKQGPRGATFRPTTGTRETIFIGDGSAEVTITDTASRLLLLPVPGRTRERGMATWWNTATSRIVAESLDDAFRMRLTILARPVTPATVPLLICEVNNAADAEAVRIIAVNKQQVTSGTYEELSFGFDLYAGPNFIANGGKVTLRSFGGNIIVSDPKLLIKEG